MQDTAKGDVDTLVEEYYDKYEIILEDRDPEEFCRHVAVQAHMLEVCPSIADGSVGIRVNPLAMGDWAAAMGIETVYIDNETTIRGLKNELLWNSIAFR